MTFPHPLRLLFVFLMILLTPTYQGCGDTADGGGNNNGDNDNNDHQGGTACAGITAPSWNHPWPMFHGFEDHVGLSDAPGPQNANAIWTFDASNDVGNPPNSIAIAEDGTIYLAGGNKVYSINPNSHATNWSKSYTSAQGPALSADGTTLYFGSNQSVVAVNTSDGSEKWTYATEGAVHFGPTVGPDGTVYQGSWDHNFYALSPDDGTVKWQYETAGAVSYPPSILSCTDRTVGTLILLGGGDAHEGPDGNLYAFDTDGNLEWQYDTGQLRVGSPAISPEGLIYAPASPTLYVLDSNGDLQWSLGGMGNEISGIISPAIAPDGTIYLPNSKGDLSAISPTTHAAQWTHSIGSNIGIPTFPVVDSAGTVYFGGTDNTIYAVDKEGNETFHHATGDKLAEAAPALVDGLLYISSDDGNLYVIGP